MFLDIFESAENQQYFKDETNLIWLHGTLLCKKLGFKNVSQAIQMHTDEDERQQIIINGRAVWFVSEYGVWGLILEAKTEDALTFKRKLKRDILPKLRASGGYIMPNATSEQLEALQAEIAQMQAELDETTKDRDVAQARINFMMYGDTPDNKFDPYHVTIYKYARNFHRYETLWLRTPEKVRNRITKECDETYPHHTIALKNAANIRKYVTRNGISLIKYWR